MSTNFKDLQEKHGINSKSAGGNKQSINMPVRITGYEDNKYFIGQRIDTKEMVRIKLREDVTATGKNARPEVTDFQDKKSKRYAPINDAILLFDNTYLGEDGVWVSRWANTLHKKKMKASVVIFPATVRFVDEGNYIQVRVIKNRKWIQNEDELKEEIIKSLQPKGAGARPFVHVRIKTKEENYISTIVPKMIEVPNEDNELIKVADTGENSYEEFNKLPKANFIKECCLLDDVTIEILTGAALYLGGDTRDRFFSTPYLRKILEPSYLLDSTAKKEISNYGYQKTVLAIREIEDTGMLFIADVKPLVNNETPVSITDLDFDL